MLPHVCENPPLKKLVTDNTGSLNRYCQAPKNRVNLLSLEAEIEAVQNIIIRIDPEGDLSKDEIDFASISDYTSTGLGPRRLRAETAARHAVGLVSARL